MSENIKKLEENVERRLIVLSQTLGDYIDAVRTLMAEYRSLLQIQEKLVKEENKGKK